MAANGTRYTTSHCWARRDGEEIVVGITDYAQEQMSELTFVELPADGERVDAEEEVAVVESVKTAHDVYAPVAGTIVAANEELAERPELVNEDPFGRGWLFRMRPDNPADLDALLDQDAYEAGLPEEEE